MAKIVVTLGGNALGNSPVEQLQIVKQTAISLANLLVSGNQIVLSHGNGPQIGEINLGMNFAAEKGKTSEFSLPECGAMSQGYIGYQLQQSLQNELNHRNIKKNVVSVITQVEVNQQDPAFENPSKPIGSFYDEKTAKKITASKGYIFKEDSGRGYRRVVPSPLPQKIIELNSINRLIEENDLVIAVGGGGIPVIRTKEGFQGIPAVIDKDYSSALLADKLNAQKLIILTSVDEVYLNYKKIGQTAIHKLDTKTAENYLSSGQFAEGSMLPKIKACIDFVKGNEHRQALITSLKKLDAALNGKAGTLIEK